MQILRLNRFFIVSCLFCLGLTIVGHAFANSKLEHPILTYLISEAPVLKVDTNKELKQKTNNETAQTENKNLSKKLQKQHQEIVEEKQKTISKIELMKQKVREQVKAKQTKSKQDQQNQQAEQSKVTQNNSLSLKEQYLANLSKLKKNYQKTLDSWKLERKKFLSNIQLYKEATYKLEDHINVESSSAIDFLNSIKKKFTPSGKSQDHNKQGKKNTALYYHLPLSFTLPIRNQGPRATCASFAGVRAIELQMNNPSIDLSEQYFHFLSKKNCQRVKCSKRGSWVTQAFKQLKTNGSIPYEKQCPYSSKNIVNNQTQLPLKRDCFNGSYGLASYDRLANLESINSYLHLNRPVIIATKLDRNFYLNEGFVGLKQISTQRRNVLNAHSMGHAYLIEGYIKLDPNAGEGNHCYIVANSWGTGWGQGGYSCIGEKWIKKHLIKGALISPLYSPNKTASL